MPEINSTFTYKEVLMALRKAGWDNILPEEYSLDNPDEVCVEFTTTAEADDEDEDDDEDDDDEDDDDEDDDDTPDDDDEELDSIDISPDECENQQLDVTVPSAAVLSTWNSLD